MGKIPVVQPRKKKAVVRVSWSFKKREKKKIISICFNISNRLNNRLNNNNNNRS